jgi:hypothetical protein
MDLRRVLYGIRNVRATFRAVIWRKQRISLSSTLHAWVTRASGRVEDLGLLSSRVVTIIGADYVANDFGGIGGADVTLINFHDAGTGVVAENEADTGLGTAWGGARVAGTQSHPGSKQYRSVATITFNATFAITEHIIAWASSGASTTFDRSVFSAVNVNNGDAITFTYTLTVNSNT